MGFRFRKSIKLMPGVRVNLGKKGASLSLGGRGATVNVSSKGTRTTVGIPGTGLSHTSYSRRKSKSRDTSNNENASQDATAGWIAIIVIIGLMMLIFS